MSFPKVGLYGVFKWNGQPFIKADGTIDQSAIINHAKWPVVSLEIAQCLHRPDVVAALRVANPNIRILGFMDLAQRYFNPDHSMDATNDFNGQCYKAVADTGDRGFVWSANYPDCWFDPLTTIHAPGRYSLYNMNLSSVNAVVALAQVVIDKAIRSNLFDGIIVDQAQHRISWASGLKPDGSGDIIDYIKAGFIDAPNFDTMYLSGHTLFFNMLSDAAPPDFSIEFNCSTSNAKEFPYTSGQMEEGFPKGDARGTLNSIYTREINCKKLPLENWINMAPWVVASDGSWSVLANTDAIKFGLACACMTDTARLTVSQNGREPDGRERIWHPIYDLALGEALGPPVKMLRTWYRLFTNGIVFVDFLQSKADFYMRAY